MSRSRRSTDRPTTDVSVALDDGSTVPAALALPRGSTSGRAVVILHEALGLNDDIRRIAARFAANGYVAVAPDFLAGLGPMPFCLVRFFRELGRGRTGQPHRQLDAVRDWVAARPDVDQERMAVVGFCVGGGFALVWAATSGRLLRAAAPFYAPVARDAERSLAGICPTVASYGGRDTPFREMPRRLESALAALGVEHDVKVYPDAGHSFMNRIDGPVGWLGRRLPMHAGLHEPSAEDAWRRTLAFLDRHLTDEGALPAGG